MDEVIYPGPPAVEAVPKIRLAAPSVWAKAKAAEEQPVADWILAGAYHSKRWERDHAGNDLSQISESDFDAACVEVASISISAAAPHKRKG